MNDLKSKLPDLNELSSMAGKLYNDIKSSVCGIINDYKQKHPAAETTKNDVKTEPKKPAAKAEKADAEAKKE